MTLVVGLIAEPSCFMIGDVMLTSIGEGHPTISYPTEARYPLYRPLPVVGLSQKVVRVRDDLYCGWSGTLEAGARFIGYLRDSFKIGALNRKRVREVSLDYFNMHRESLETLSVIIFFHGEGRVEFGSFGRRGKFNVPTLGRFTAIGSGAKAFFEHVGKEPLTPPIGESPPQTVQTAHYLLRYIANVMGLQSETGHGADAGWGAGFEMIFSKDMLTYEKMDRILYESYGWRLRSEDIEIQEIGRKFFQFYEEDNLIIFSQGQGEALRSHLVVPPDHHAKPDKLFQFRPKRPCFILTKFINLDTNTLQFELSVNLDGHQSYGLGFRGSRLYLSAHPDHVRSLIRRRIS